jgi:hypothetical protein
MQAHTISIGVAPMPPCCGHCQNLMSFKETQPWTLLRGEPLGRLTFECTECGHTSTRIAKQRQLAA